MEYLQSQIIKVISIIKDIQKKMTTYTTEQKNAKNREYNVNKILALTSILLVIITFAHFWIFRSHSKKNSRAYLVVVKPKLVRGHPKNLIMGKRIEVSYTVRNDGQTPAYNVSDTVFVKILPDTCRPEIMPTDTRDFYYPLYGSGVPQDRKVHSGKQLWTPKLYAALSDSHGIYLWGTIKYVDIFDNTHHTNFCFRYVLDEPIGEFRTYGTCNDADRD